MRDLLQDRTRSAHVALLVGFVFLSLTTITWARGKGGKPGGGGQDPPPPPPTPSVNYGVGVVPVAGLVRVGDVNDHGIASVTIRVSQVSDVIYTTATGAAALVDTFSGQVVYLDNLIPANSPWDLRSADEINNAGEIAGLGSYNGIPRRFLLTPTLNGYELTDLSMDGADLRLVNLTESGDVLMHDFSFPRAVVRLSGGTGLELPEVSKYYYELNSSGTLIGGYLQPNGSTFTNFDFTAELDGTDTPLQVLPESIASTVMDLADSGYSVGRQTAPPRKVRGGWISDPITVTYDPAGNATEVVASYAPSYLRINEQVTNNTPMIAGSDSSTYVLWVRFPGYSATTLTDLMQPNQQQAFAQLKIGSVDSLNIFGNSNSLFQMTTPRDLEGEVIHTGAPSFYGEAFRSPFVEGTTTLKGYEGIYVIRPITTP